MNLTEQLEIAERELRKQAVRMIAQAANIQKDNIKRDTSENIVQNIEEIDYKLKYIDEKIQENFRGRLGKKSREVIKDRLKEFSQLLD